MRCNYCGKNVVGSSDAITLAGHGPVHKSCHEQRLVAQRVFGKLDLQSLTDLALNELKEFVLTEVNSRETSIEDTVELF